MAAIQGTGVCGSNISNLLESPEKILKLFEDGCTRILVSLDGNFAKSFHTKSIEIKFDKVQHFYEYYPDEECKCIRVNGLSSNGSECGILNFHKSNLKLAIDAFVRRLKSDNPDMFDDTGECFNTIRIKNIGKLDFTSHYDYCDAVIEKFWMNVFGNTPEGTNCGGIVAAHGDKAYGYKRTWEDANIPFYHGVLLFLLTYTKELGDTPKHESCDWVIRNYPKYQPLIEKSEKEVLKEFYNIGE